MRYLQPSPRCNKTCSAAEKLFCDSCSENPENHLEYTFEKVDIPVIPKMRDFDRIRQKKSWKAIQDKHSRRI